MDKHPKLRFKTPIMALSLAAFAFMALSCIEFCYESSLPGWEDIITPGFHFPSIWDVEYILRYITPPILLAICPLLFYKGHKVTILITIVFALKTYYTLDLVIYYLFTASGSGYFESSQILIALLRYVPPTIAYALATISALRGFPKKVFPAIAITIELLSQIQPLVIFFKSITSYLEYKYYLLYLFITPLRILGTIAFCLAFLLFCLNNQIPAFHFVSLKKILPAKKVSPEQALRLLNSKFELGEITEEEYRIKRAEIIDNL